MRFDLGCALYAQNVAIVLPQTHGPGCDEFVITFALALSAVIHKHFSPVLPQNRVAGCHDFTTTCISVFAAMLHGFTCANLGSTTVKAGTKCASTSFPKAEKVRTWGSIFLGSSSRPQNGSQTLTSEASIEGRFR
jgi:hypothetical protein